MAQSSFRTQLERSVELEREFGVAHLLTRTCRGCGCDDGHACITEHGPCCWVLLDLHTPTGVCSSCAELMAWHPAALVLTGREDEIPGRADLLMLELSGGAD